MDAAAEGVARSAFGLSGQKCSACSRAIVADAVYEQFVDRLAARAGELALGDPGDAGMFVGPVINEGAVERYERAVEAARRDGRVAAGGGRPDLPGPTWSRRWWRTFRTATSWSATSCSCRS